MFDCLVVKSMPLALLDRANFNTIQLDADVERVGIIIHHTGGDDRHETLRIFDGNPEVLILIDERRRLQDVGSRFPRLEGRVRCRRNIHRRGLRDVRPGVVTPGIPIGGRRVEERTREVEPFLGADDEFQEPGLGESGDEVGIEGGDVGPCPCRLLGILNEEPEPDGLDEERIVQIPTLLDVGQLPVTLPDGNREEVKHRLTRHRILDVTVVLPTAGLDL